MTLPAVLFFFFMALLASRGFDTPSLSAQGRQRRSRFLNISRDIPRHRVTLWQARRQDRIIVSTTLVRGSFLGPAYAGGGSARHR
jgi:hypothetical protein